MDILDELEAGPELPGPRLCKLGKWIRAQSDPERAAKLVAARNADGRYLWSGVQLEKKLYGVGAAVSGSTVNGHRAGSCGCR